MRASCAFLTLFLLAGSLAAQEMIELRPATGETAHFEFNTPSGYAMAGSDALGAQFEEVFAVVVERLGVSSDVKIRLAFSPPEAGPCRSRGLAMVLPEGRHPAAVIQIAADEDTSSDQILGGLAHEVGHVLQRLAVGGGQSIGSMLVEGFATWAAGPYWHEWQGTTSFQSAVASYLAAGTYIPLHEDDGLFDTYSEDAVSRFGEDCLNRRDIIYTEWAAFVEYLVEEYGRDRLYSLFQMPPIGREDEPEAYGRPNFPAVYGDSLERLEAAWLESVKAND